MADGLSNVDTKEKNITERGRTDEIMRCVPLRSGSKVEMALLVKAYEEVLPSGYIGDLIAVNVAGAGSMTQANFVELHILAAHKPRMP